MQNVSFLKIQFGVVDAFKLNVLVEKMKNGWKMENC